MPQMRPVATDVALSVVFVFVCLCVCVQAALHFIIIVIIINEEIIVAFSHKTTRTRYKVKTQNRKLRRVQQYGRADSHRYDRSNNSVLRCCLNVSSDDCDVRVAGRLFHTRTGDRESAVTKSTVDAAGCYRCRTQRGLCVCLSVCVLGTRVSCPITLCRLGS